MKVLKVLSTRDRYRTGGCPQRRQLSREGATYHLSSSPRRTSRVKPSKDHHTCFHRWKADVEPTICRRHLSRSRHQQEASRRDQQTDRLTDAPTARETSTRQSVTGNNDVEAGVRLVQVNTSTTWHCQSLQSTRDFHSIAPHVKVSAAAACAPYTAG